LRFDKVALRVIARLQSTLHDEVPSGKTLLVALSAPIRLPSKTVVALDEQVRLWMAGGSKPAELRATIYENQIRVRIISGTSKQSSRVLVFVHNPDVDTTDLLDAAQSSVGPQVAEP
jgi:hypothetical protein